MLRQTRAQLTQNLQHTEANRAALDAEAAHLRAELAATDADRDKAIGLLQQCRLENKALQAALTKKQAQLEESTSKFQTESSQLKLELQQFNSREPKIQLDLTHLRTQVDELTDRQRVLETQNNSYRREQEQMIKSVHELEKETSLRDDQLSLLRTREVELRQALDEVRLERDAATSREDQARKEIGRLDDKVKTDVIDVKKACEGDKARFYSKCKEKEEKLREEARAVAVAYAELEQQRDQFIREKSVMEAALSKFGALANAEQAALMEKINALQTQLAVASHDRDLAIERLARYRTDGEKRNELWCVGRICVLCAFLFSRVRCV
jgi:chromosome segregation ATPase